MFRVFSYTEAGGHPRNEDAFEVRAHPLDKTCLLCALADGQGGQAGGGRAAQLACATTLAAAATLSQHQIAWDRILRQADDAVAADREAGFTTLIGFALHENCVLGASSGDSALLAFDASGRVFDLTRSQMKNPPVGCGDAVFVPFQMKLQTPWTVLAMSDGVWKYVGMDGVQTAMMKLRGQALIDSLQQSARMKGSGLFQDDFTVIVIQDSE